MGFLPQEVVSRRAHPVQSLEERRRRVVRGDRRPPRRVVPRAARTCTAGAAASTTGSRSEPAEEADAQGAGARPPEAQGTNPLTPDAHSRLRPAAPGPVELTEDTGVTYGALRQQEQAPEAIAAPVRSAPPTYGWLALGAVAAGLLLPSPFPAVVAAVVFAGLVALGAKRGKRRAAGDAYGRSARCARHRRRSDHRRPEIRHRRGAPRPGAHPRRRPLLRGARVPRLAGGSGRERRERPAGPGASRRGGRPRRPRPRVPAPRAPRRVHAGARRGGERPRPHRGGGAGARPRAGRLRADRRGARRRAVAARLTFASCGPFATATSRRSTPP